MGGFVCPGNATFGNPIFERISLLGRPIVTTDNMKLTARLWLLTWLVGGASCCWQATTGLMGHGQWLSLDLLLGLSGLALIIPGLMLLTRVRPGTSALFTVAHLGGWFLGTIALVNLPTGGIWFPLTGSFFVCGLLYGVLGFVGMAQNRNDDGLGCDDLMERIAKGGFGHYFHESKGNRETIAGIWGVVAAVATGVTFNEISQGESTWLFVAIIVGILVTRVVRNHRKAKLFPKWVNDD
jgi:hypothetical protein